MGVCEPQRFTSDLYYVFSLSLHFCCFLGLYGRGGRQYWAWSLVVDPKPWLGPEALAGPTDWFLSLAGFL